MDTSLPWPRSFYTDHRIFNAILSQIPQAPHHCIVSFSTYMASRLQEQFEGLPQAMGSDVINVLAFKLYMAYYNTIDAQHEVTTYPDVFWFLCEYLKLFVEQPHWGLPTEHAFTTVDHVFQAIRTALDDLQSTHRNHPVAIEFEHVAQLILKLEEPVAHYHQWTRQSGEITEEIRMLLLQELNTLLASEGILNTRIFEKDGISTGALMIGALTDVVGNESSKHSLLLKLEKRLATPVEEKDYAVFDLTREAFEQPTTDPIELAAKRVVKQRLSTGLWSVPPEEIYYSTIILRTFFSKRQWKILEETVDMMTLFMVARAFYRLYLDQGALPDELDEIYIRLLRQPLMSHQSDLEGVEEHLRVSLVKLRLSRLFDVMLSSIKEHSTELLEAAKNNLIVSHYAKQLQ